MGSWQFRRRLLSVGLLGLALLPFPRSCQRAPGTAPAAPPAPNYYELGEQYFDAGNYSAAVEAYKSYLESRPNAPNEDRVLLRLALAYSVPESPAYKPPQAAELLEQLISQYPNSPYKTPADFVLHQIHEIQQKNSEIEQLTAELGQREARIQELALQLQRLKTGDLQKLEMELSKREERIRQLSEELEKLKRIDLERRPTTTRP